METSKLSQEELEKMSHLDIAYNLMKFDNKNLNTVELLKEICTLLNYDSSAFENLIGDFYTSLNLDKRFILIDGKWDLSERHQVKIVIEDEADDDIDTYEDMDEEESVEDEAVLDEEELLEDLDDEIDDDMEDLTILDEEEIEDEEEI